MTWAKANGKLVSESEWKTTTTVSTSTTTSQTTNNTSSATSNEATDTTNKTTDTSSSSDSQNQHFGNGNSEELYDLKGADTTK